MTKRHPLAAGVCLGAFLLFSACGQDEDTDTQPVTDGQLTDTSSGEDSTGDMDPGDGNLDPTSPGFTPQCETNEDCADGLLCSCQGLCLQVDGNACEQDKNCGSGTWCDPCVGHCMPLSEMCDPCTDGGACGFYASCVPLASGETVCGSDCQNDSGCLKGFLCVPVDGVNFDQCVPASGSCLDLGLCEDDGDCPDGEICQDTLKQCGQGCDDDLSCPVGQVCSAGRCDDPCGSDADCLAPALCEASGHCKIPGACESSAECEPEHHCNKATGKCEPGCLVDTDCQDASRVCEAMACVPKGCVHNYQCAFGEECDDTTGVCVPTPDPHCATCDGGAQDPAAACGGEPNLCVTLKDKDDVEKGDFCFLQCADDPVDQCPMGYGCTHIDSGDGQVDGYFCTRECWVTPVGG